MALIIDMFPETVYRQRRHALRQRLGDGLVLLPGHVDAPVNFAHNCYPFRQDATFSYFFGLDRPGLIGLIDLDTGDETLFADDLVMNEVIWRGTTVCVAHMAAASGCRASRPLADVQSVIQLATDCGRTVHFLPPYRGESAVLLARLTGLCPDHLGSGASQALIRAVVALREIKDDHEIGEIESALHVTHEMHRVAMQVTRPGVMEREVVAEMRRVLGGKGLQEAYPPIFSRRGEILHNLEHGERLQKGDLVINDAGASSAQGYASDITRTLPVGGRFLTNQRDLYELLHEVQTYAIGIIRPGIAFRDVHRLAALKLVEGMTAMGFFSASAQDIVDSGAYALCFPHGLGHQLGLDVHDMESLGEDAVGYDEHVQRSPLFGLNNLRLGKTLKRGMVLTVEPGIYFIPSLIKRWHAERRHEGLICYPRFFDYEHFGGMRIEDVVMVSDSTGKVLGPPIPKHPDEVEAAMS
ncbi:MAG TPA: Xaa-Pro aminopeptidase [Pseudomonas sp.]|uniref:aminopeptidase P family protein n=1 Tax=Pseudomonas sp. TaxID=306 RepID=UPI002ED90941